MNTSIPSPRRSILTPVIALAVAVTLGSAATAAVEAVGAPAADVRHLDVSGQLPDDLLTGGDLGVATALVADDAAIITPDGALAGPAGVQAFLETLAGDYPEARFGVTGIHAIGSLLTIDWQGEADGAVVHTGRTLANIEDGRITRIFFVDPNAVAPVQGQQSADSRLAVAEAAIESQG